MDPVLILGMIAALTALAATVIGPLVSLHIAKRQIASSEAQGKKQLANALETVKAQISASSLQQQRQIRAELVSANRQAWINGLREAFAEFLALSGAVCARWDTAEDDPVVREKIDRFVHMETLVELMLNPDEEDHNDLIRGMDELVAETMKVPGDHSALGKLHLISSLKTQRILKREWERVKAGD